MLHIILILFIQSTEASQDHLMKSLQLVDQKKYGQALNKLGEISKNSPFFQDAFEITQKINYRKKSWDKLFASFYYYKIHFMINEHLDPLALRPHILILEPIALGKLCRYKDALIQILNLKRWYKKRKLSIPEELYETEAFVVASIKVNGYEQINNETFDLVAPMTKDAYWRLQNKQVLKLKSPHHLRMNIKSLCKK